jgi:hypothetical protein
MTTHLGKDGVVQVGAAEVAEVVDFSVTESADTHDDTSKGDDARTFKAGHTSWAGSLTCRYDPTDTNGQEALRAGATVSLTLQPVDGTSGNPELTGSAIVTEVGEEYPLEGLSARNISFQGSGALGRGTVT